MLLEGYPVLVRIVEGDSVPLKDDGFGVAVGLGNTLGESVRTPGDSVPLTADGPGVAVMLGRRFGVSVGTPGDPMPLTVDSVNDVVGQGKTLR
jgi:hypothetical protein